MKKFLALSCSLVLLATGVVAFAGCGNGKTLVGFDIDLARAVAEELGVELECQEIDWNMKEAELDNGSIDMAWNGFTYTEDRDNGYFDEDRNQQIGGLDFSGMYMVNKQVAVVRKENAQKYATAEAMQSVADSSFVAEAGSAGYTTIQSLFSKTPTGVDRQLDIFTEVSAGTAEIGFLDAVMAGYYITSATGAYHDSLAVVELAGVEEEYYAIGFREHSNLPAIFNNILAGFVQDGTVQEIAERYGLQDVVKTDDFGTYDPDMDYSALTQTNGKNDYQAIMDAGKMVLGYTLFAPMAYNA